MLKQRRMAAEKVAKTLFDTETAIDGALAQVATLVGVLPMARQEAGLAATIGQPAIDRAVEAMAALAEARRAVVAAHEALFEVQGRVGLGAVNFGTLGGKPDWPEQPEQDGKRDRAQAAMRLVG